MAEYGVRYFFLLLLLSGFLFVFQANCEEILLESTDRVPAIPRPKRTHFTTLLSIDGGGLRLLYTTQLLKEIEAAIKEYYLEHKELIPKTLDIRKEDDFVVYLADYFECISGVSAGSWVALYLASKGGKGKARSYLESHQIVEKYGSIQCGTAAGLDVFFLEYGDQIYPSGAFKFLRRVSFRPSLDPTSLIDIPGLNAPLLGIKGIGEAIERFLGDTKFSDLYTSCLVNAYDLQSNSPVVFVADHFSAPSLVALTFVRSKDDPRRHLSQQRRKTAREKSLSGEMRISELVIKPYVEFTNKDVALASSALPIFNPAYVTKPVNGSDEEFVFIDGGLVESNPTLYSLNFITSRRRGIPIYSIAIISLGSGGVAGDYIHNADRGAVEWGLSGDVFNIITSGSSEAKESQVDYLLYESFGIQPGQYLRINYFAEDPDSKEGNAFASFNSDDHLSTYIKIGKVTAQEYSTAVRSFVSKFVFLKK